jgi:ATP-dependent exoDNAse (exonuclease V) alpha subunit
LRVLLVGDHAQLSPVAAGGAFRLLTDARGPEVPILTEVHRFTHAWEAEATLELRAGRTRVAQTYLERGRVEAGTRDEVLDRLFEAWLDDTTAGKAALMVASDAGTVTDLNTRARAKRVALGLVEGGGVTTREGAQIGVGDIIVTRLNSRALSAGDGWVKNGDDWIVTARTIDGGLTVTRLDGTSQTVLPAGYVHDHVDLGYATTAHRAQGRTVDTTHAYVSITTTREALYVMASRGRDLNRLYVDTTPDAGESDIDAAPDRGLDAGDVLRNAIATGAADVSAHHTETVEYEAAAARWRLEAEGLARRAHSTWPRLSVGCSSWHV